MIMNREMLSYFNLSEIPFTKEIPFNKLHQLPSVEKNVLSVKMLVELKGIGVMTGKSGSGKSCVLRLLKHQLSSSIYKVLYICHSSINVTEFYTHLSACLGLTSRGRRSTMFREIKEKILSLHSGHIHPVLIIDEADLLNYDILQDLRLLTNFDIDSLNAMTVLLCGQESLLQKFSLSILEPLANSIVVSITVDPLPQEETYAFIEKRIKDCGNSAALFTKQALAVIHQASGGIFRSIGTIAQSALYKAFLSKASEVEAEHVKSVIER